MKKWKKREKSSDVQFQRALSLFLFLFILNQVCHFTTFLCRLNVNNVSLRIFFICKTLLPPGERERLYCFPLVAHNRVITTSVTSHSNESKLRLSKWDQFLKKLWCCVGGGVIHENFCITYRITCTLCKKLYIGETGRRLGDRFREHLRDVEKDDKDASKPVERHFNLPNHSKEHMSICGLSLHQGTTDSRKNLEQRFIFQIGTLYPHGINERFSFN